ncbi:DMT family transporter, partial [Ralstonia pseudosolanacearum]|uniref:DMT family transporter n=1 Tax=Ralstonia pseudosolanacearum TaxID=1310165 RepID=UPI003221613E
AAPAGGQLAQRDARIGNGQHLLSTLEPVVTVALAALLLGESIGAAQMAGGALILAGVLWLTRADARPGGHRPDDMA